MTTQNLKDKIITKFKGHGHFTVIINYNRHNYSFTTTNTLAIDKIGDSERTPSKFYITEKQALLALWNEGKRHFNLR